MDEAAARGAILAGANRVRARPPSRESPKLETGCTTIVTTRAALRDHLARGGGFP